MTPELAGAASPSPDDRSKHAPFRKIQPPAILSIATFYWLDQLPQMHQWHQPLATALQLAVGVAMLQLVGEGVAWIQTKVKIQGSVKFELGGGGKKTKETP